MLSCAPLSAARRVCLQASAEGEPRTPFAVRALCSWQEVHRTWWHVTTCAHLSFAGVSAPGHAAMVGEKRLAQHVPGRLVFCWPLNTLGSACVESHHKVAAALVSPRPSWCTGERNGGISEERTQTPFCLLDGQGGSLVQQEQLGLS